VKAKDAHLGAAFDFAADRVCFFDETGARIRHDAASTLLARELLRRHGGGVMLYDLRASAAFREVVSKGGGKAVSSPAGRLAVARAMRKTDALYATDLHGRHYFKGFYRSNSPMVALLLMCSIASRSEKPMSELVAQVDRYHHSGEIKVKTPTPEAARAALEAVDQEYQDAERERKDGLTVRFPTWWFNLRGVGERPELRLNVEGRTEEDEQSGRREVLKIVEKASSAARQEA
jgi:phosphomannomutase